jgi:hypothetical protein
MMGLAPRGSRASAGQAKKDDINLRALPLSMVDLFHTRYTPVIRDFTGTLELWKSPTDAEIWDHATTIFAFDFQLEFDSDLFTILSKLVRAAVFHVHTADICSQTADRLSDWRTNFAKTAMTAVEKYFEDNSINEPAQRASWAKWLLGTHYKFRPFYYRKCHRGAETSVSGLHCASRPWFICSIGRQAAHSCLFLYQPS